MDDQIKKFDIITVGSATRDVYIESEEIIAIKDDRFSTGEGICLDSGSKSEVESIHFTTGGSAVNTAVTFARRGLNVGIVARVGKDVRADMLVARLKENNISTDFLIEDPRRLTAYSVIIHSPGGDRSIFVYRGASSYLASSEVDFNILKDTSWIFVTHLAHESSKLFEPLLKNAIDSGVKIAFNPGSTQLKLGEKLIPFLDKVDILFLNQEEASVLTGIDYEKESEIFKTLDEWVRGIVVMTKGKKGVVVSDGKTRWVAGSLQEPVFADRTGAGDAFASGFTSAIIRDKTIEEAIQTGSTNATGVIGEWGANRGLLEEDDALDKFGTLSIKKTTIK